MASPHLPLGKQYFPAAQLGREAVRLKVISNLLDLITAHSFRLSSYDKKITAQFSE